MVLGSHEDMQLSAPIRVSGKSRVPVGSERRDLSARKQTCLWPEAVIAYVIDEEITAEQLQNILHAIGEWNDKTVMSLGRAYDGTELRAVPECGLGVMPVEDWDGRRAAMDFLAAAGL